MKLLGRLIHGIPREARAFSPPGERRSYKLRHLRWGWSWLTKEVWDR